MSAKGLRVLIVHGFDGNHEVVKGLRVVFCDEASVARANKILIRVFGYKLAPSAPAEQIINPGHAQNTLVDDRAVLQVVRYLKMEPARTPLEKSLANNRLLKALIEKIAQGANWSGQDSGKVLGSLLRKTFADCESREDVVQKISKILSGLMFDYTEVEAVVRVLLSVAEQNRIFRRSPGFRSPVRHDYDDGDLPEFDGPDAYSV